MRHCCLLDASAQYLWALPAPAKQVRHRATLVPIRILLPLLASLFAAAAFAQTDLHDAVLNGAWDEVQLIIAAGADLELRDGLGMTALHTAAWHAAPTEVVRALLDSGADVDARTPTGVTPLSMAASHYQGRLNASRAPEIVRMLITSGADVDAGDDNGWTPLHRAAFGPFGKIHEIAPYQMEVLSSLLLAGADVNARTTDGSTVLTLASRPEVAKLIAEAGGIVDEQAIAGVSLASATRSLGYGAQARVVEARLLEGTNPNEASEIGGFTPLHNVALNPNADPSTVALLVRFGADVDSVDSQGNTALVLAIRADHLRLDVVRALLDAGAAVSLPDTSMGFTSLHHAVSVPGRTELVKMLLGAGANVNSRSFAGFSPLMWAVGRHADLEVIEVLVASGADISARSIDGSTALEIAITDGGDVKQTLDTIRFLVSAGADLHETDSQGRTHLMNGVVFSSSSPGVVSLLVEMGLDVNARDSAGMTALHLASLYNWRSSGVVSIIRALLEAGADASIQDSSGKYAFDYAMENDSLRFSDVYWILNDARF